MIKDWNVQSAYPLSPLQMGMLYHALKEPGSGVDIEQIVFKLREPLDLSAWERAWKALLQRYDILRSSFHWEDVDAPVQFVEPEVPVEIIVEDWANIGMVDQKKRLREVLQSRSSNRFQSFTGTPDALSLHAPG